MAKWKPVPGFEGVYIVSDQGQVVRIATHGKNPKPLWRPIHPDQKPNGYVYVDLQKHSARSRFYLHRLVWEAFKGPIPSGLEPNHKRGIKTDNRLSQLELLSRSDNMLHGFAKLNFSRNRVRGSSHHKAKLSEADVLTILRCLASGVSWTKLAKMYNVSKTAIGAIARGRSWKQVTRQN
jgi:hypothetical protein